jgi:hypothetical protein
MKRISQFSAADVATWMLSEFNRNQVLFHDIAVARIREISGTESTHFNDEGNYQFDWDVFTAFRSLAQDTVVWERQRCYWRKRSEKDQSGRAQH